MPLPGWPDRPSVRQDFIAQALTVGTVPTPIVGDPALASAYIDSFIFNVPSTAANPVFLGNPAVTVTSGLEVTAGSAPNFAIDQGGRMLYELLRPILDIAAVAGCKVEMPDTLPFVSWDLSQIYAIAAANTACVVVFFRNPFV